MFNSGVEWLPLLPHNEKRWENESHNFNGSIQRFEEWSARVSLPLCSSQRGQEFYGAMERRATGPRHFQAQGILRRQQRWETVKLIFRHIFCCESCRRCCCDRTPEPPPGLVFGRSLSEIVDREGTVTPSIVRDITSQLNERGGLEEGPFRIPGNVLLVRELVSRYDEGATQLDLSNEEVPTLASTLKQFLRELREPLVPFANYEAFSCLFPTEGRTDLEVRFAMLGAWDELPPVNRESLRLVLETLHIISHDPFVEKTLMQEKQLSAIIGQGIMRHPEDAFFIRDMGKIQLSVQTLIQLFPVISEK